MQSGLLVEEAGRQPLLLDCGCGVLANLQRSDVAFDDVGDVLLTHNHLDHVNDLIALVKADWLVGREELRVWGPPGTRETVEGFLETYPYMQDCVDLEVREVEAGDSFQVRDWNVSTLETEHSVPSMALRLDGEFVYSGDTEPVEEMRGFADECEVLVHECSFPDSVDVGNHTHPSGLADVLDGCGVSRVYLTHLYPHVRGEEQEMIETIEEGFDGVVGFAEDMMRVGV